MKPFKTLLFILWTLKLSGQSEETFISQGIFKSLNIKGDFHLALGGAVFNGNGSKMFGSEFGISARFKNHIYTNLSVMGAKEITLDLFGLMPVPDKIERISVVAGGHFSGDFFYLALGCGIGRQNGQFWNFKTSDKKTIQNLGLDIKVQASLFLTDFIAIGINYNLDVNNNRNFRSLMIGLQFGRLR
jgi:hypothetical protein